MKVFQGWVINQLRRLSLKWPPRSKVKTDARLRRGIYKCALCLKETRAKDIFLDHIEPVVDPKTGFVDYNTYIARLFVPKEGFQAICRECHDKKTLAENMQRKYLPSEFE